MRDAVASACMIRRSILSHCLLPYPSTRALLSWVVLACYTTTIAFFSFHVRHAYSSPSSVIIAAVFSNASGCHSFTVPLHSFLSYTRNSQPG